MRKSAEAAGLVKRRGQNRVQAALHHPPRSLLAARVGIGQQEAQNRGLEEFGRTTEATVDRIKSRRADAIDRRNIQRRRGFPPRSGTPHFVDDHFALVGESLRQAPQVHLDIGRRNIDRPRKDAPVRQCRNQRRPAPGVVVPGDIRAREGIDPHPDENLFHQLAQRGGRIRKQALATGRRKIDE